MVFMSHSYKTALTMSRRNYLSLIVGDSISELQKCLLESLTREKGIQAREKAGIPSWYKISHQTLRMLFTLLFLRVNLRGSQPYE